MKEKLKIVFMGTPEFAVPSLDILVKAGYDIAAVVTVPDKPAGRGQQLKQSAVKKYALENGLKILQPSNLKDPTWIAELESLKANLQVVVAFRMLPEAVWKMPSLGTFNLHASLLPQYRGAAPINWTVINGENETGLTTFFLQHEIDTGSVICQQKISVSPDETAGELHNRLMAEGAALVLKTVRHIEAGDYTLKKQNEMVLDVPLKPAPKITKETCRIKKEITVKQAYDLVRGLSPYPAAFVELKEEGSHRTVSLKVFKASYSEEKHAHAPGEVHSDDKSFLHLFFSDGILSLLDIQAAGKSGMPVKNFLNGFKFTGRWTVC